VTGKGFGLDELIDEPLTRLNLAQRTIAALGQLEITSVYDLITYFPRRYVDRSKQALIAEAIPGEQLVLTGKLESVRVVPTRGRASLVEARLVDMSGAIKLRFFNQPYRARQLKALTQEVAVFGRIELFHRQLLMTNPLVDPIGDRTGQVVAIYPQRESAGINSYQLAKFVASALDLYSPIADTVPKLVRSELNLLDRTTAFRLIHFPESIADVTRARRRLAFDELFRLQLVLASIRLNQKQAASGFTHDVAPFGPGKKSLVKEFLASIPFSLTKGQSQAILEIAQDMASDQPMHRLLQGDVGSGKTLVSLVAMLFAVQSGHQAALVAPTEVLAEQHYRSISELVRTHRLDSPSYGQLFEEERRPVRVELLTGSTKTKLRERVLKGLADGDVDIVVGTHALFSETVGFSRISLVVVDEQHRFGVEQRFTLRDRAASEGGLIPDTLVMTATPIPRTAAMTVFGDLDLSVIGDMPPGRTPVETSWARTEEERDKVFEFVRSEVARGRQAYVVYPLVAESAKLAAKAAEQEFERLSQQELAGLPIALLHGKMAPREKEQVMEEFRSGKASVLVATTVIEVGVDVPNATVMVVEDADRFGIAQLHQLRGRVGRGTAKSWCFLLSNTEVPNSVARLEALVEHTDGFKLAEIDLELRGEGTILGARQSGRSELRLASLAKDRDLVAFARAHATVLVDGDSNLDQHPWLSRELSAVFRDADIQYLQKS
jgi:ATP-dependent DNA helicase RecG